MMDHEMVLSYSQNRSLWGEIADCQGQSEVREPGCEDVLRFYLKTNREIITEIRYTITESACPPARACAALAASLALDKPVMEAYLVNADQLSRFFGELPKESYHCALMAEIGLKKALQDYAARRQKIYSREACTAAR